MSAPNNSTIILSRDEPLEDEKLSLAETVAYVAGYLNISIDDARERVMDAIAAGELRFVTTPPSGGNH